MHVNEDNMACIEWGNNVIGGRERAKHIDIRKHFAQEAIKNGHLILNLDLKKVQTTLQLADIMTKGVKQPAATPVGDVHGWDARQAARTLHRNTKRVTDHRI